MALGTSPSSLPAIGLADPIRDVLVGTLGLAADSKGQLLGGGGVRARFRFAATRENKDDRNVFGLFPGSDPEKKKEVVVFSAHYDHVGVDEKGEIFNGSDDNASGTSTLLEIAEAFGQGPRPARSVAFLWVSGEEKGLLGSHWFADHMNLPAGHKIVADINLDMVSRNDAKKVGVTPSPKHGDYNSLVPAAQASCQAEGMEVVFDADQFYFRTDSYSFASKGIPVDLLLLRHPRRLPPADRRRREGRLREGRPDRPRRLPPRLASGPGPRGPEEDQGRVEREERPRDHE